MTHGISKTAVWVAAGRAIGARQPDLKARNPDRLAEALLGDPSKLELQHPVVDALRSSYEQAMQHLETAGLVRAMIERTRFIDEALERAVAAGAVQVLIPGAASTRPRTGAGTSWPAFVFSRSTGRRRSRSRNGVLWQKLQQEPMVTD